MHRCFKKKFNPSFTSQLQFPRRPQVAAKHLQKRARLLLSHLFSFSLSIYNLLDKQAHKSFALCSHFANSLPSPGGCSIILPRSLKLILLNFHLTSTSNYTKTKSTHTQNTGTQHFIYMLLIVAAQWNGTFTH